LIFGINLRHDNQTQKHQTLQTNKIQSRYFDHSICVDWMVAYGFRALLA
jgi:hypothetical protein